MKMNSLHIFLFKINKKEVQNMKDLFFNYNRWRYEHKILYITGYSGAGKSTLAKQIQKEVSRFHKVIYLNLDIFFFAAKSSKTETLNQVNSLQICDTLKDLLVQYFSSLDDTDFGYYKPPKMIYSKFILLSEYANNFIEWVEPKLKNSVYSYIFEGTTIYMKDPLFFKNKPIILLGASYWKSSWRGVKRAIKRKVSLFKFIRIFYNRIITMYSSKNSLYKQHFDYLKFREDLQGLMDTH